MGHQNLLIQKWMKLYGLNGINLNSYTAMKILLEICYELKDQLEQIFRCLSSLDNIFCLEINQKESKSQFMVTLKQKLKLRENNMKIFQTLIIQIIQLIKIYDIKNQCCAPTLIKHAMSQS